jgi:Flp pilus assembly protein TadD
MELTIEQALQQGVAAHKEGKVQEAERLYRAILQSQPSHPDANHNLGVIAVSVNNAEAALPLFKTALDANPNVEQFWMSYIDALFKNNQVKNAKQAIKKATKKGFDAKKLQALRSQPKDVPDSKLPSQAQLNSLLMHYQNGKCDEAEKLAVTITQQFPQHQFAWKVLGAIFGQSGRTVEAENANQTSVALSPQDAQAHSNLGITLKELGRLDEAEKSYNQAIALKPNFAEAHSNLGNTLQELGRLDEAEASYKQAIALKPDYAEAHYNLGITLQELGRLDESEAGYTQAIALKPDYAEAHSNLGITLQELGRLDEAETSYNQAIALKPDYAEAHYNLGITLQKLGRLDEADAGYTQAIALKPDYAEAHSNLGNTLQELGRLDEAETSYRRAIALKSDFAQAHYDLGKLLYIKGYKDLALKSVEKANDIDPQKNDCKLLLNVMKSRKSREESETAIDDTSNTGAKTGLTSIPLILNRVVEADLIANLYGMSSRELDKTTDARYGSGKCSPDFNLFQDSCSIIQNLAEDLTRIMKEAVKSEVFIYDSFFNILGAGGGTTPHRHLNDLDKDIGFNLGKQKYSLVYYLSVGDQHCSEPGMLKLYDPVEDILPGEGMITIIPASRLHSAVYGGTTDRIMIGVNFYSL